MSQARSTQERRALFFTLFIFLSIKEKCECRGKEKKVKVPLIPISHQLSPFSPAGTCTSTTWCVITGFCQAFTCTHAQTHTRALTCTSMCTGVWWQGLCFSLLLHKYYPVDHIALQLSPRNSTCWTFSHVNIYGASLLVVFFFKLPHNIAHGCNTVDSITPFPLTPSLGVPIAHPTLGSTNQKSFLVNGGPTQFQGTPFTFRMRQSLPSPMNR